LTSAPAPPSRRALRHANRTTRRHDGHARHAGEYLEIEFFADDNVEVGRFRSQGLDSASDADLDAVIAALSS
jgi:hypothetical protein